MPSIHDDLPAGNIESLQPPAPRRGSNAGHNARFINSREGRFQLLGCANGQRDVVELMPAGQR